MIMLRHKEIQLENVLNSYFQLLKSAEDTFQVNYFTTILEKAKLHCEDAENTQIRSSPNLLTCLRKAWMDLAKHHTERDHRSLIDLFTDRALNSEITKP